MKTALSAAPPARSATAPASQRVGPQPGLAESMALAELVPRALSALNPVGVSSGFFRVAGPTHRARAGGAQKGPLRCTRLQLASAGAVPPLPPGGFRRGVHGRPRAPALCPPARCASPGLVVHVWARRVFCFQRTVSLRSRLDPRRCRDRTHRLAMAPERSIRMFIKYSIYAVCPRSHRPKIKPAV